MLRWNSSMIPKSCLEAIVQLSSPVWQGEGRARLPFSQSSWNKGLDFLHNQLLIQNTEQDLKHLTGGKKKKQAHITREVRHTSGADTTSHLCLHQLSDVGLTPNVVFNAIQSTFQGGTSHQQDEQDDVREECSEVDNLQKERCDGIHRPPCRRTGQTSGLLVQKKNRQGSEHMPTTKPSGLASSGAAFQQKQKAQATHPHFRLHLTSFRNAFFWHDLLLQQGLEKYPRHLLLSSASSKCKLKARKN